jgi:hypothetical protein
MLAVLAGTSVAMAAPRESFNLVAINGGPLTAVVRAGAAGNTVVNVAVAGSDGGGSYTAKSLTFSGTLSAIASASYALESRILVTPPGGTSPFVMQFSTVAGNVTVPFAVNQKVAIVNPTTTAGTWRFENFEEYDDAGTDTTFSAMTVTFDDADVPVAMPSGATPVLTFNNVASNGTAAAGGTTMTFTMPTGLSVSGVGFSGVVTSTTWDGAANHDDYPCSETRIKITSPSGQTVTITPITQAQSVSSVAVAPLVAVLPASEDSLGTWSAYFYESTDNVYASMPGSQVDSVWATANFTLIGPLPPTISGGTATPATVGSGSSTLLTVTVAPGSNPVSTGLTVTSNLTSIGDSASAVFHDDGLNGDAVAGNGVYSYNVATVTAVPANYTLTVTAADAQLRSASTNISLTVAAPTPPVVTPNTALLSPTSLLVTGKAAPGTFPASTGITLSANLTAFGGGANDALFDDGTNGDVTGGDGVWSKAVTIPVDNTAGTKGITVKATDAQARTGTATTSYNNFGVIAGSDNDLTTEDVRTFTFAGHGSGMMWAKFNLHDAVQDDADVTITKYLDIDTEGTGLDTSVAGTLSDTEIGLYKPDGTLATATSFDDDSGTNFHSMLTYGDVAPARPTITIAGSPGAARNGLNGGLAAGDYYLALGNFNVTFNGTAFGATSANTGNPNSSSYTVNFRTNLPKPQCSPADVGAQGGVEGNDNHLDNNDFIVFINYFFAHDVRADLGSQGGVHAPDNAWDNNDFVVFIDYFFNDTPNCTG